MLCVASEIFFIYFFINKQTIVLPFRLRFEIWDFLGKMLWTMVSSWVKKNAGGRRKARVFRSLLGHMCFIITIWKTTVSVFPCALWEWLFPTKLQTCNQSLFRHHKNSWWFDWVRVLVFSLSISVFQFNFLSQCSPGRIQPLYWWR